jgi:hypothetical protein
VQRVNVLNGEKYILPDFLVNELLKIFSLFFSRVLGIDAFFKILFPGVVLNL